MFKSSFTVRYQLSLGKTKEKHLVLGVTSIVPNLNGFLFFTEDGRNHFVESHELRSGTLANVYLSYEYTDELDPEAVIHDHRRK